MHAPDNLKDFKNVIHILNFQNVCCKYHLKLDSNVSSYLFFATPKGEVVSHPIPSATYRDEKAQLYIKNSCENDMKLFHSLYLILTLSQLGIIHITRVRATKSDFSLY